MTEKQASSEIAQSRARFEKAAKPYFNNGESFCPWDGDHYADEIAEGMWQMYLAAERDTRERVAQELKEIAGELAYGIRAVDATFDVEPEDQREQLGMGVKMLRRVAERIRGKE
jgi:hypothetical protein